MQPTLYLVNQLSMQPTFHAVLNFEFYFHVNVIRPSNRQCNDSSPHKTCFVNFLLCLFVVASYWCDQKALNVKSQICLWANQWHQWLWLSTLVSTFQQQKIIKNWERGKIQEYLSPPYPPIFWVEPWKKLCQSLARCLKVAPIILSLYQGFTIYLKSTFDTIHPLKLHISSASPWYVINVYILTPFPFKDIISLSSYIYCWKKLNYCDFIVAPAPKWFLVISHHFSCSAEVISWNSKCFLLYSSCLESNQANLFFVLSPLT